MKNFFANKLVCLIGVLLAACFVTAGCGFGLGQSSGAPTVAEPSQMPAIVFVKYIDHSNSGNDGGPLAQITFLDNEGNYYTCEDFGVCALSFGELVTEFEAGRIDDKVMRQETIPVEDVFERYQVVCEISVNKDYALVTPDAMPAVEADRITWYGLYYDQAGALQSIKLHANECLTDIPANDQRANGIYAWYDGLFS